MDISVIGGSGFIGTRLIKRLALENFGNLRIVDKKKSKIFPDISFDADVRVLDDLMRTVSQDGVIINLAAEHRDNVTPIGLYDDVNVGGARNICEVARRKNIKKIIFTSTVAVYGFAPIGTDETGEISPFNDYGRSKYEAEKVFVSWQEEDPNARALVIIRPTVVFGEQNRGNVYNLLRQVASGNFLMVGEGKNKKSMAYVENISAFIEYALQFKPGIHIYNFVDKPDFSMNGLIGAVNKMLGKSQGVRLRLPYWFGFSVGKVFDGLAVLTGRKFTVSSIRVKKFCSDTVFNTSIEKTGFVSPVPLVDALERTVHYEFLEDHKNEQVFFSE